MPAQPKQASLQANDRAPTLVQLQRNGAASSPPLLRGAGNRRLSEILAYGSAVDLVECVRPWTDPGNRPGHTTGLARTRPFKNLVCCELKGYRLRQRLRADAEAAKGVTTSAHDPGPARGVPSRSPRPSARPDHRAGPGQDRSWPETSATVIIARRARGGQDRAGHGQRRHLGRLLQALRRAACA